MAHWNQLSNKSEGTSGEAVKAPFPSCSLLIYSFWLSLESRMWSGEARISQVVPGLHSLVIFDPGGGLLGDLFVQWKFHFFYFPEERVYQNQLNGYIIIPSLWRAKDFWFSVCCISVIKTNLRRYKFRNRTYVRWSKIKSYINTFLILIYSKYENIFLKFSLKSINPPKYNNSFRTVGIIMIMC